MQPAACESNAVVPCTRALLFDKSKRRWQTMLYACCEDVASVVVMGDLPVG